MPEAKRTVRVITEQRVIDKPSGVEGFPLRKWSVKLILLGEDKEEMPSSANIFNKVTYRLHESFGDRMQQIINKPPFEISEEGWGEFEMTITCTPIGSEKGGETFTHDLNFQSERYEVDHKLTFKNPKPALIEVLRASGKVPGEDSRKGRDEALKRKKKIPDKGLDMDRLAENLQKLHEDDLLAVVQLIHDNKTPDCYTKNDVDAGEFHVDLYTLPDNLLHMLTEFVEEKLR